MLLATMREKPRSRASASTSIGVAGAGDRAGAERQRVGFVARRRRAARSRAAAARRAPARNARRAPAAPDGNACNAGISASPAAAACRRAPRPRRRRRAAAAECGAADTAAGRATPARCATARCAAGVPASPSRSTSSRSTKLWTSSSAPSTKAGLARPCSRMSPSAASMLPRLVGGEHAGLRERARPRHAAGHVVFEQPAIEAERRAPFERGRSAGVSKRPDQRVVIVVSLSRIEATSGKVSAPARLPRDASRPCPSNSLRSTMPVTPLLDVRRRIASSACRSGENQRPPWMRSAYSRAARIRATRFRRRASARGQRACRSSCAGAAALGQRLASTPCAPAIVARLADRDRASGIVDAIDGDRHAALERDLDGRRLLPGNQPRACAGGTLGRRGRWRRRATPHCAARVPYVAAARRRRPCVQSRSPASTICSRADVSAREVRVAQSAVASRPRVGACVRDRGRLLDGGDLDELLRDQRVGRARAMVETRRRATRRPSAPAAT